MTFCNTHDVEYSISCPFDIHKYRIYEHEGRQDSFSRIFNLIKQEFEITINGYEIYMENWETSSVIKIIDSNNNRAKKISLANDKDMGNACHLFILVLFDLEILDDKTKKFQNMFYNLIKKILSCTKTKLIIFFYWIII